MLRRITPRALKLGFKLTQRAWSDTKSGQSQKFASSPPAQSYPHSVSITQPILNATTEQSKNNKVHNIRLAARLIEDIEIKPQEVFSFWRSVGHPSKKNGYKKGINIIEGNIVEDYGGGLCQLSSIIYHTALVVRLSVIERSNHSVDLYQHQERYTPLGSDSAVFYGYKDLRLRNDFKHPVSFRFEVLDETITCHVTSPEAMEEHSVEFLLDQEDDQHVTVITKYGQQSIATSSYKKESAPH